MNSHFWRKTKKKAFTVKLVSSKIQIKSKMDVFYSCKW